MVNLAQIAYTVCWTYVESLTGIVTVTKGTRLSTLHEVIGQVSKRFEILTASSLLKSFFLIWKTKVYLSHSSYLCSLYDGRLFTPASSATIQNRYKHFCH